MSPIHYLKARNSDYLAGTDLEIFDLEGKSKSLTISKVEYKENFLVNGRKKPRGLVVSFKESYAKPFIVNTTNSRIINEQTGVIDASKWVGFTLNFFFDEKVTMRVSQNETLKGGIRIKSVNTNGLVPPKEKIEDRINKCTSKAEIMSIWRELDETQQNKFNSIIEAKYKSL